MIVDNIENISKYKNLIPDNIVKFIEKLKDYKISELKEHRKEIIHDRNYANFDIYNPKPVDMCKFEAHKKYIDIQIMLKGEERIDITNTDGLEISEEYDEDRDVMFFKPPKQADEIILSNGKFVLIYPHEAHRPQVKTTFDEVKKVVVKVSI